MISEGTINSLTQKTTSSWNNIHDDYLYIKNKAVNPLFKTNYAPISKTQVQFIETNVLKTPYEFRNGYGKVSKGVKDYFYMLDKRKHWEKIDEALKTDLTPEEQRRLLIARDFNKFKNEGILKQNQGLEKRNLELNTENKEIRHRIRHLEFPELTKEDLKTPFK